MKNFTSLKVLAFALLSTVSCQLSTVKADGWPSQYRGVMLQGFYWDSYKDTSHQSLKTSWTNLQSQSAELSCYFDLVWVPQSGTTSGYYHNNSYGSNGYDACYWLRHNSIFGTQTQLIRMVNAFKTKGTGIIEDVVLNHKNGLDDYCDFPQETSVTGPTTGTKYSIKWNYKMGTDGTYKGTGNEYPEVCSTDEAVAAGYNCTGAADEGEDFNGYRDLDHTNANVQANIKTYLTYLQDELGYTGFRYDMTKGFSSYYIGKYNSETNPQFTVGELWDGESNIKSWISGTANYDGKMRSASFDFAYHYSMKSACDNNTWSYLANEGVMKEGTYRRYSVTFVDNHDTYGDDNNQVKQYRQAANAMILFSPGTPCLFMPDWYHYGTSDLKTLIQLRKAANIHNESEWTELASTSSYYAQQVTGLYGANVIVAAGSGYTPSGSWTKVASGTKYTVWLNSGANVAWSSLLPGVYSGSQTAKLTAYTTNSAAKLVYTTDGTTPSAINGTIVAQGSSITIDKTMTLTLAVIIDGVIYNPTQWKYFIDDDEDIALSVDPYNPSRDTTTESAEFSVYVQPSAWGCVPKIYAWKGEGTEITASWPGNSASATCTDANGNTWYQFKFTEAPVNIVINDGGNGKQTANLMQVSTDQYIVLKGVSQGNYYGYAASASLSLETTGETGGDGDGVTAYVVNSNGWNPLYVYAWNTNGELCGAWPGTQMSATASKYGKTWYKYSFGADAGTGFGIIFNDGTSQTPDLTMGSTDTYFVLSSSANSDGKYEASQESTPLSFYLISNLEDVETWTSYQQLTTSDNSTYSINLDNTSAGYNGYNITFGLVPRYDLFETGGTFSVNEWPCVMRPDANADFTIENATYTDQPISCENNNQAWLIPGTQDIFVINFNLDKMTWSTTAANASGISLVEADGTPVSIYDLQGRKRAQLQKGVNIVGDKRVLVP